MITAAIWCIAYAMVEIVAIAVSYRVSITPLDEMRKQQPQYSLRLAAAIISPMLAGLFLTIAVNS